VHLEVNPLDNMLIGDFVANSVLWKGKGVVCIVLNE
jgi:hypothetical protein